jgi:molybdopterin-guanine dinucleotide biosynthesis protein A
VTALLKGHAYLLAAGRGRRAGGPKAWQSVEGRPLLERQVAFATTLFEARAVAVAIQAEWLDRCRQLHDHVRWVPTDPDLPALASLLELLRKLPLTQWGFVWHVDMPVWHRHLFEELARAAQAAPPDVDAVLPTFENRGGHPLLLSPRATASLTRLDAQRDRLDHWQHQHHVLRVAVSDPAIHLNWNHRRSGPTRS